MLNRIAVMLQYLLPKQALTLLAGKFSDTEAGWVTTAVIRWFVRRYGVNMSEAAEADIERYSTFNQFFTRELRADARPLASTDFICPVDGTISQFGHIESGWIFQAKGHEYSAAALLGGSEKLAEKFANGSFATLYLSPKDYHRIHMPCAGRLKRMIHVPGSLFSVNPLTAQEIPGLFARNERVVCEFESEETGSFVMVLVGATIVGSMATQWHGVVNPPRPKQARGWKYDQTTIELGQGDEMGRFLLGSTVILLFPQHSLQFSTHWHAGKTVRMGEAMAVKPAQIRKPV